MATYFADVPVPEETVFIKVRKRVNEMFDSLVHKMNERREVLLAELKQWEEEFTWTRKISIPSIENNKREQAQMLQLLADLQSNQARVALEKGISDLNEEIDAKEQKIKYPRVSFTCNVEEFDLNISELGSLTTEKDVVKNYMQISEPVKIFGDFGLRKTQFTGPRGLLIDEDNQAIYVSDFGNSRIQIWSWEGVYLSEFGRGTLEGPWEIILCDNFIYVSDYDGCFISKWSFDSLVLVDKSDTFKGPEPGQLDAPSGIDADEEEIFVVEWKSIRISVFDLALNFKRTLADKAIYKSHCLRVRNDTIYIVEDTGIIKLFSKADQLLRTIQKNPSFSDNIFCFSLDNQLKFLITDRDHHSLYILSPEGDLIRSFSFHEFGLNQPFGICSTSEDEHILVCFQSGSNAIAIFDTFIHVA